MKLIFLKIFKWVQIVIVETRKQFWSIFITVLSVVIIGSIIEIKKYYNQGSPTSSTPPGSTTLQVTPAHSVWFLQYWSHFHVCLKAKINVY